MIGLAIDVEVFVAASANSARAIMVDIAINTDFSAAPRANSVRVIMTDLATNVITSIELNWIELNTALHL